MKTFLNIQTSTALLCAFALPAAARAAGVAVVVENLAPPNGTWLTPLWIGFHDGSFDTHDLGGQATVELERLAEDGNTGPLSDAFAVSGAGTSQATVASGMGIPPLGPGESAMVTFWLDEASATSQYFSFASMVIPSNDAFMGNDDPQAHPIFDGSGNFLGGLITILGADVKDAGTEVNDEIPAHTAFFGQITPNTGVDENGVVRAHSGHLPPGSGGILDDPMFAGADFTQPGYQVARIFIYRSDTLVPAGNVSGIWDRAGSPYLVEGDITVPAGETLIIEPGVTVFFQSWWGLTVRGHLEAVGTESEPIVFTATPPGPGEPGWKGIRFVGDRTASRLTYCTVENAKSTAGDPYRRGGGVACEDSNPVIHRCIVRNNQASLAGGGIYALRSEPVISESLITGNSVGPLSSGEGGGIACDQSTVEITGNTITANDVAAFGGFTSARASGGGVSLRESDGIVARNIIAQNTSHAEGNLGTRSRGGGFSCSGRGPAAGLEVVNNTVTANTATVFSSPADGGGIALNACTAMVLNTIVEGNTGTGAHFEGGATATVGYSDFHANTGGDFGGADVPPGLGQIVTVNANGDPADAFFNIFLEPVFENPGTGDWHLRASSPCIDAGDPTSPPDPDGTVADIGALFFPQTRIPGDVNGDGVVDVLDLLALLSAWGPCPAPPAPCPADIDGDGFVAVSDLLILLANWTA